MPRRQLRVVNNMPDNSQQQAISGVSLRTVIIVTLVTTIASQLVIDGYKIVKKKLVERRAALANPHAGALPPHPGVVPMLQLPQTPPWQGPPTPEPNPESEPTFSAEQLRAWEAELERKENRLNESWSSFEEEQRHLRLVGGA